MRIAAVNVESAPHCVARATHGQRGGFTRATEGGAARERRADEADALRQAPADAEAFGRHLARLYRHLLQHNQAEWVELDDELGFVERCLHLLNARFAGAYRRTRVVPRGLPYDVVPGALQELIGNIVKHNDATAAEPIDVELRIDGDTLIADSANRPRRRTAHGARRGLALLDERYRMQSGRGVTWRADPGRFVVARTCCPLPCIAPPRSGAGSRDGSYMRTYTNSDGRPLRPLIGGAIQLAILPGSYTGFIRLLT